MKTRRRVEAVAIAAVVLLGSSIVAQSSAQSAKPCSAFPVAANGWQRSYQAGCRDRGGKLLGGSELLHLVAHKGQLYAANGYWEDRRNPLYGGGAPNAGWSQVLRLDRPDGTWQSDLELGPRYLRAEILKSITFATDGNGHALASPENMLVAATFDSSPGAGPSVFVRDDALGTWSKSKIFEGATSTKGEDNSVRAMIVHRDAVTGVDRVFISVGVMGIFSGVYDAAAPGHIRWDGYAESPPTATRTLAIAEANGSLFFAAGTMVYRRIDGPAPSYVAVTDMSDLVDTGPRDGAAMLSTVGGVRGLTAIANPAGTGQSLLFLWGSGARSQACLYRLDPDVGGGYVRQRERCLAPLVSAYLGGAKIPYALGAYNNILAVRDPATNGLAYLIGLEAFVAENPGVNERVSTAPNQRRKTGGFYAGALYAIRNAKGEYRIGEVDGPAMPSRPPLVSVRAYAISPFSEDGGSALYVAGYDADWFPTSDSAWIYRVSLATLLRSPVSGLRSTAGLPVAAAENARPSIGRSNQHEDRPRRRAEADRVRDRPLRDARKALHVPGRRRPGQLHLHLGLPDRRLLVAAPPPQFRPVALSDRRRVQLR
jgi:hypothetical protein